MVKECVGLASHGLWKLYLPLDMGDTELLNLEKNSPLNLEKMVRHWNGGVKEIAIVNLKIANESKGIKILPLLLSIE